MRPCFIIHLWPSRTRPTSLLLPVHIVRYLRGSMGESLNGTTHHEYADVSGGTLSRSRQQSEVSDASVPTVADCLPSDAHIYNQYLLCTALGCPASVV